LSVWREQSLSAEVWGEPAPTLNIMVKTYNLQNKIKLDWVASKHNKNPNPRQKKSGSPSPNLAVLGFNIANIYHAGETAFFWGCGGGGCALKHCRNPNSKQKSPSPKLAFSLVLNIANIKGLTGEGEVISLLLQDFLPFRLT
jgi:hypothetical protein